MDMKVKARGDLGRKFSRDFLLLWALWVISDLNMPDLLFKKKNFYWCLSRLVAKIAKYANGPFQKKSKGTFEQGTFQFQWYHWSPLELDSSGTLNGHHLTALESSGP